MAVLLNDEQAYIMDTYERMVSAQALGNYALFDELAEELMARDAFTILEGLDKP
jgi:hypothetical protein